MARPRPTRPGHTLPPPHPDIIALAEAIARALAKADAAAERNGAGQ